MIWAELTPLDAHASVDQLDVDVDSLTTDQVLDALEDSRRLAAWVDARQMRLLAAFATQRPALTGVPGRRVRDSFPGWLCEYAADEVAPVLLMSPRSAQERLLMAVHPAQKLPATMATSPAGTITLAHARTVAARTGLLDPDDAHTVENQGLPKASEQTPTQLGAGVERAVIAVNPAAAQARRDEAVKGRRIEFAPYPDGLASLWLIGPTEQIAAARTGIEAVARRHRRA